MLYLLTHPCMQWDAIDQTVVAGRWAAQVAVATARKVGMVSVCRLPPTRGRTTYADVE